MKKIELLDSQLVEIEKDLKNNESLLHFFKNKYKSEGLCLYDKWLFINLDEVIQLDKYTIVLSIKQDELYAIENKCGVCCFAKTVDSLWKDISKPFLCTDQKRICNNPRAERFRFEVDFYFCCEDVTTVVYF